MMAKKLKKAQDGITFDQKVSANREYYKPTNVTNYKSGKTKQATNPSTGLVTNVRRSGMVKSFVDPSTGEKQVYRPRIVGSPHALKKKTNAQGVTTRYSRSGKPTVVKQNGGPTKKTGPMHEGVHKSQDSVKNTPPTGSNSFKTGVYKGTKLTPAQIKQSQQDWIKKEKEMTNPKNKPAGSPMRKLQKGGSIKRK